jgi:hypothetical protein
LSAPENAGDLPDGFVLSVLSGLLSLLKESDFEGESDMGFVKFTFLFIPNITKMITAEDNTTLAAIAAT